MILVACRLWARERSEGNGDAFQHVLIPHPPDGPVAAGVARTDGSISQRTAESAESMVRVLSVERLIAALAPELRGRLSESRVPQPASVRFVTELGEATLGLDGEDALTARVPHKTLGQLALGAQEPGDVLDRLRLDARTRAVLVALFPKRHQHMYAADRY